MASVIWLGGLHSVLVHLCGGLRPLDDIRGSIQYERAKHVIIAKGNRIEGIEAME